MAPKVVIYEIPGHPRSRAVCRAIASGIRAIGETAFLKSSLGYRGPEAEVAVFYGLAGRLSAALRDYKAKGLKAVYIDLGYWKRKDEGRFAGYHKLSINDRHPTAYFQKVAHSDDRARALGVQIAPWSKPGGHVIVAGMGPKGARAEGFAPNEWETSAVKAIRAASRLSIAYRPKPNWEHATPIPGTTMRKDEELEVALRGCHALVAHHSNACVEALVAGVPIFTAEGVASVMGSSDLSTIDRPARPEGREQWLADLAYCQWSVAEMASGAAWRHLKDEGLVP